MIFEGLYSSSRRGDSSDSNSYLEHPVGDHLAHTWLQVRLQALKVRTSNEVALLGENKVVQQTVIVEDGTVQRGSWLKLPLNAQQLHRCRFLTTAAAAAALAVSRLHSD